MSVRSAYVQDRLEQIIMEQHKPPPPPKHKPLLLLRCANPECLYPEFNAKSPRAYCCNDCKRFDYRRKNWKDPEAEPVVSPQVQRLQEGQMRKLRKLELQKEIDGMRLSTSEHTPEELAAIRAEAREKALQGRTRVVGFNGGGPSE